MALECTVPELGENVESATVVEVFVKAGDAVRKDQPVLSLETDKAEFEMPSNVEGTVAEILVGPGDEVKVGQAVLRVQSSGAGEKPAAPERPEKAAPPAAPEEPGETRAKRTAPASEDAGEEDTKQVRPAAAAPRREEPPAPVPEQVPEARGEPAGVAASPSVRRLARELGVAIAEVRASGAGGRVTEDDVKAHVRAAAASRAETAAEVQAVPVSPDFSRWGPVEAEPMSKVRLRTAEQMARAWAAIPHVTHHDAADVTELERLRRQYAKRVEQSGGKLTMTAVLLKVLGSALKKFPKFNASVDMQGRAIIYKKYVHVGVAVDTERGLLVPVIRDVDQKNIVEIALALKEISEKARGRNIRPEELQGASFTLTNLGGIGGRAFSPLINPPEVAVLGVASTRQEPVYVDGAFEPRLMLPLSVSYDHRVIDGADAARFLRWVCEALGEPFVMDLEGE